MKKRLPLPRGIEGKAGHAHVQCVDFSQYNPVVLFKDMLRPLVHETVTLQVRTRMKENGNVVKHKDNNPLAVLSV